MSLPKEPKGVNLGIPDTSSALLDLDNIAAFQAHPWLNPVLQKFDKDAVLSEAAAARLAHDLEDLNSWYYRENGRVAFTTIEGRVKPKDSMLRKLQDRCRTIGVRQGLTQQTPSDLYLAIHDICGVRFSCPYYDEVKTAINDIIRPHLRRLGYAVDLTDEFPDKDYLDQGDDLGYRSYHIFIRIPTRTDIFGNVQLQLCELQGRSELQHVWAVKSHDLLYDPTQGWIHSDRHVVADMIQLSNSLRAADQWLVSVRDRVRGE